jgi:Putative Ig domain/Ricin-type beta-trefoil lectin domain-like
LKHRLLIACAAVVAPLAVLAGGASAASATTSAAAKPPPGTIVHYTTTGAKAACATAPKKNDARCLALIATDVQKTTTTALPAGYGPQNLISAYNLPTATTTPTVAVVDAYDDPNAAADDATYRSTYGLPACTVASGCFTQVNEDGATSPLPPAAGSTGWATEESLDVDMVSAICPTCHILLVEANSPSDSDLATAVNSAVADGATYISNSYGIYDETSGQTAYDSAYEHQGVAITASAGDSGYGPGWPATNPDVTAVGGTSLTQDTSTSRGWTESVWGSTAFGTDGDGTGSGCSAYEAKPSWQTDTGCSMRTANDVAAVADPNTGVAVYDTYDQSGFLVVGGTSASSPIIASIYALAGTPAAGTYPVQNLYANHNASNINDVTVGENGTCSPAYLCTAEVGYDGPTGWGTPNGVTAFQSAPVDTVTVTNPGNQTGTVGTAASLQIQATSSGGHTLTYSASGLPAGLSISSTTGLISGTPTTAGTSSVTVTATDSTGASGSATFTWTVSAAANKVTVTNPGSQTGTVGTAASLQIQASDSASGQTLTYSATGLPAGLSISSTTGLISGTPTTAGTSSVTVTATDTTGASGSTTFTWTISAKTGNTVTVTNPGTQTTVAGTAVSLQIKASDSVTGQTLTYTASGLPAGLSINSTSGLISGTPTTAGSNSVTVTATDTTGASGSASFTWTITSAPPPPSTGFVKATKLTRPQVVADDRRGVRRNGAAVQSWEQAGLPGSNGVLANQTWTVVSLSGGNVAIQLHGTNLCVDVTGYGITDGTKLQLYTCGAANYEDQTWKVLPTGQLEAVHASTASHKTMVWDDPGGIVYGAQQQIWQENGRPQQYWTLP